MLYVYLQCLQFVTTDRFAPPGEEEPASAFVQLIKTKGAVTGVCSLHLRGGYCIHLRY